MFIQLLWNEGRPGERNLESISIKDLQKNQSKDYQGTKNMNLNA